MRSSFPCFMHYWMLCRSLCTGQAQSSSGMNWLRQGIKCHGEFQEGRMQTRCPSDSGQLTYSILKLENFTVTCTMVLLLFLQCSLIQVICLLGFMSMNCTILCHLTHFMVHLGKRHCMTGLEMICEII